MSKLLRPEVRERVLAKHAELRDAGTFLRFDQLHACYTRFYERFGPKALARMEGKTLLEALFLHGNKDSLVYWLEFKNDEELPDRFGGIGGGSAYKFILFKQKETGQWTTGSPRIPKVISEEEAIELATKLRDQFIAGCKVLDPLNSDSTYADYQRVNAELIRVADQLQSKTFAHKYFALLFPDVLDDFHALKWQQHHLRLLGTGGDLTGDRYENAYYFKELTKELGVPMNELTITLNIQQGLPRRYWRIGTSFVEGHSLWPIFQREDMVAVGWPSLGDLKVLGNSKPAKMKLAERLAKEYDTAHAPTASRKAGEIMAFRHKIEVGDIVLAANGQDILAIGVVSEDYEFVADAAEDTCHRRSVDWLVVPERPFQLPIPSEGLRTTCKEITKPDNMNFIEGKLRGVPAAQPTSEPSMVLPKAGSQLPPLPAKVQQVKAVLDRKGQVILYGPPGTGKTHWARIAAHELSAREAFKKSFAQLDPKEKEVVQGSGQGDGLVRMCTFHPAYGYEDFLEGYRPTSTNGTLGFERRDGIFKRLCQDAAKAPERTYYLLVDEINRGDIPRIFGELLTLLEMDKRGMALSLPLSGEPFRVPANVRLIGTMNTADRSIALLDTALRRRFGFIELMPEPELLREMVFESLPIADWLKVLNGEIRKRLGNDGRNLQIGHAFFMQKELPIADPGTFLKVLLEDIVPLLEEYFYDSPEGLCQLLGSTIMDPKEQRINRDLLAPGRRADVIASLAQLHPELLTSAQAMDAVEDETEGEEEEEQEEPATT